MRAPCERLRTTNHFAWGGCVKAIRVEKTGGPEVMTLQEVASPGTPAAGQALVRIMVAGVNFIDVQQRRGSYPRPLPFTPGV